MQLHWPDPDLADDDFILRQWRTGDVDAVVEACQDPDTQAFVPIPRPYRREDGEQFVAQAMRAADEGRGLAFALADPSSDQLLGSMTLHATREYLWHLGYWTAPWARRRGITTRAVRLLSTWAFSEYPGLHRISLFTLVPNVYSQLVAERAGYQREGILRKWDFHGPEPVDVVMFSLVRSDLGEITAGR